MRFITALALFTATVAAAATPSVDDAAGLAKRACVVDCACLDSNRSRFWEATERCCRPNGGEPDNEAKEYCRRIPEDRAISGFASCCGGGLFECRMRTCS